MDDMNTNNKRVGTIILAVKMVEASWPNLLQTIGCRFWPFRVQLSPNQDRIAYTGWCDEFDEIGPTETPSQYTLQVGMANGVVQKVQFIKVQPPQQPKSAEPGGGEPKP